MENNKYRNTNDIDDTEYRRMRKSEDSSYEYHEADAEDIDEANVDDGYPEVTDFGKFIDPVADKLLVLTTLIMLIHLQMMPAWVVIIVLCRELSVDGLRLVAVTQGKVIAAGPLGKWKTTCQMILISIMLILNLSFESSWPVMALTGVMVLLTVSSAMDYFVRNRSVLAMK